MIMLLFLSHIITILELVSSSVIPNRRTMFSDIDTVEPEVQLESTRVKREIGREWVKVCPTEAEIVPIIPAIDDEGIKILQLGLPGNLDYQEYVRVERCRDTMAHVGGVTVKCEQEYLEHTLVVFDPDTGQERVRRPFFYPSGCSARVFNPS